MTNKTEIYPPVKQCVATAHQYALDVVSGKIIANSYIIMACKRYLKDREADNPDWYFSEKAAEFYIDKFRYLNFISGLVIGKPIYWEPWQLFFLINLYGWRLKYDKSIPRYRNFLIEVPRKNSKSTLASAIVIIDLLYGPKNTQVYSVASKQDQAKIVWDMAKMLIENISDEYKSTRDLFKIKDNLTKPQIISTNRNIVYRTLGRDSKTQDGLQPRLVIFDEAGGVKSSASFEVLVSGQAMSHDFQNIFITTAYYDKTFQYYNFRTQAVYDLENDIEDSTMFALIFCPDEGDAWDDIEVWRKVNPNWKMMAPGFFEERIKTAKKFPSLRNSIITKNLNQWCSNGISWMPQEVFCDPAIIVNERHNYVPEEFRKCPAVCGVDMSSKGDLTAFNILFMDGRENLFSKWKYWLPKATAEAVPAIYKNLYNQAVNDGILTLIDRPVIDVKIVQDYIEEQFDEYDIQAIGFDPAHANIFIHDLMDKKLPVREVPQTGWKQSNAVSELESLLMDRKIKHVGHSFTNWQFDNAQIVRGYNNNLSIQKPGGRSGASKDYNRKIDAVDVLTNSVYCYIGDIIDNKPEEKITFFEF